MPNPILAAASGSSFPATATEFDLPTINPPGDDVILYAIVSAVPDPATIVAPAGWSLVETRDAGGETLAIYRKEVPVYAGPYHDTFEVTGGAVTWGMIQFAFRSAGGSFPANHELNSDTYACITDPSASVTLPSSPTATRLLLGIASLNGCGGPYSGSLDWSYNAGWTEIFREDGVALVAAYRVADGTSGEDTFTASRDMDKVAELTVVIVEDVIVEDPDVEPTAWDIYDAEALTGPIIGTLVNAKGRWIRSELHGLGEGGFTLNRHASEANEELLAEGNMVKVRIEDCGPDYIDGFFLPGEGDYTLLSGQGGKGREDLVFRGPGALSYLDRARMTPCAYSIPPDIVGTWDKVWTSKAVGMPVGVAFDPDEPNFVYVIGAQSRKIRKVNQTTREVLSSSPALWSGTSKWAAGLSFDPDDDTIAWVLEAPWINGSSANTKIRKVRRSDWEILDTWDLGSAVKLTDIRVDGDFVWTSRYDNDVIQQRSKSNAANVVDSSTITYKGKVQRKPNGIAINGTQIAYWFGGDGGGGTGRALIADTSDPWDIVDVQRTNGISGFGGEWTTEGGEDFLYVVSYTEGKVWKYQLTESVPACVDESGVFHPEQVAPGALAWRVLVEITHADRPVQPVPELSYDFTEDEDSNGTPWPPRTSTEEFTWRVGDRAFSDVLARLIPAGVTFDLDVNTMTLHAYVDEDFGTDRSSATFASGKVRFQQGTNLAVNGDLGRRDNRGLPDTYITVAGDGGKYGDATLAGRYVREGFMQVSGPSTAAILDAIGDDELARQRLESDALGFETLWANAPLAGSYIPFLHYWKGDLVTVDMVAGEFAYNEEELRIYGTLITERDIGWRSALDLGSAYKVPPPITSLPGESNGSGSGAGARRGTTVLAPPPLTVSDGEDVNIPRVTKIIADGVTSPSPGVAVIPNATAESPDAPLLEELSTDETDTTLVPHPDGVGGVAWGADEGGGAEPAFDHNSMGATETLDLADGTWHRGTLSADCTITVQGFTVDEGVVVVFEVAQDGTGGRTITWDADVEFISDDQPEATASSVTVFLVFTSRGDSTIYGVRVGGGSGAMTADDIEALGFVGPILMADGITSPPEPLFTEDGTDYLYADL